MTIADIFDRSVSVLVRRWQIALIGTLVPALIDAAGRAFTHSSSLWFMLTVARIGVVAFLLSAQIREFGSEASESFKLRFTSPRASAYGRSLQALSFNAGLGFVLIFSLVFAEVAAYRTYPFACVVISLVAIGLAPLTLLVCSTAYSFVILESVSTLKAFAMARQCVFEDVIRSWLLGSAMTIVVVAWYVLVELLARLVDAKLGPACLIDAIPLFEAPGTAYGTALSGVIAVDYLTRSNICR